MAQAADPTAAGRNLLALPEEITCDILRFLSPEENLLSLQRVCKHINRLANGHLLWRFHCLSIFTYWHPKHDIEKRMAQRCDETDWKGLYRIRATCNREIAAGFEGVVAEYKRRAARIQDIVRLGYDAKDFLLTHCRADHLSGDGLARRFHAHTILGSIHRDIAITEWLLTARGMVSTESPTSARRLERVMGAFDLFVLHDQPGDLGQISSMLDQIASDFRKAFPNHDRMTTREKALALLHWLKALKFVGLRNRGIIGNLRICLLGHVLRDEKHDSSPAISSIIFCSVACRLGLDAYCCELPTQAHVVVRPPQGVSLDGWPVDPEQQGNSQSRLILCPFGNYDPVSEKALSDLLPQFGWDNMPLSRLLNPLSSAQLAFKTAVNLNLTVRRISKSPGLRAFEAQARLSRGNDSMNLESCLYATSWAELAMSNHRTDVWKQSLSRLVAHLMHYWPEDAWLVEKHLSPLHQESDPAGSALVRQQLANLVAGHPCPNPNAPSGNVAMFWTIDDENSRTHLPFWIGHVFRHTRHNWYGVVIAWHDKGMFSMPEYDENGGLVDRAFCRLVPHGNPMLIDRYYFKCLTSAHLEPWVVRPDYMELVTDSRLIGADTFPAAGNFFSHFDAATCTFVSNVREQLQLAIPNQS